MLRSRGQLTGQSWQSHHAADPTCTAIGPKQMMLYGRHTVSAQHGQGQGRAEPDVEPRVMFVLMTKRTQRAIMNLLRYFLAIRTT